MKFGIVVFPGSNCDHDAYHVAKHVAGQEAVFLWHKTTDLEGVDAIILPGGFSYGDYLRAGAIARFSPIMKEVVRFAKAGGPVLGICNGFQILLESGLLPGALLRNESLNFVCKYVHIRVENTDSIFTRSLFRGQILRIPVAHGEGNYYADEETIQELEGNNLVVFRYSTDAGEITRACNPNGSVNNIAGITHPTLNVLGMMPHPERCAEDILGSSDGLGIFHSLIRWYRSSAAEAAKEEQCLET